MRRIKILSFFAINFLRFLFLGNISKFVKNKYMVRGCKRSELKEAEEFYKKLSGRNFSSIQRVLFWLFSQRFLFVSFSLDGFNKRILVGLNVYYINYRDFKDKTIHEGYIGVASGFEGRGVATQMRKQAIEHFKENGFKGISSRISKKNLGSLRSAEKLGFRTVESYFDEIMQEERCYLIKWFY